MPSKKSKLTTNPPSLWKAEPSCSEFQLETAAAELAAELVSGDRVILEGAMGAGKSTFARALLRGLGIEQPAEGSPTFAIAHEYQARASSIIHMDLYRLRSEEELEEAGISSYLWDRDCITLTEWLSQFPKFETAVLKPQARPGSLTLRVNWKVKLDFDLTDENRRAIKISKI
ncbi:MAG: tRNA (adenosine(37)-N6)-threonylcarbamoyltransferase complex ATPase subunit type 1 TsaE [Methylotenera sp.]|nr:tRNA (adenosine(37)-N6)-threonylcarbamoyltransferase complex ATPase subunit type 1 TsaE [Oligoflexia bacterium]